MTDEFREAHAKRLLEDELFTEAFDVLKKDLMGRWEASGSAEVEARESIWLAMRLLDKIHGHITSIVETGRVSKILEEQHPHI